jgi:hypothetical protein
MLHKNGPKEKKNQGLISKEIIIRKKQRIRSKITSLQ